MLANLQREKRKVGPGPDAEQQKMTSTGVSGVGVGGLLSLEPQSWKGQLQDTQKRARPEPFGVAGCGG